MGSTSIGEVEVGTKFRRVPAMFKNTGGLGELGEGEKEKRCERTHGHVLIVTDKGIKCRNCPAEWRDYRF